jgi:hypothetical protein
MPAWVSPVHYPTLQSAAVTSSTNSYPASKPQMPALILMPPACTLCKLNHLLSIALMALTGFIHCVSQYAVLLRGVRQECCGVSVLGHR